VAAFDEIKRQALSSLLAANDTVLVVVDPNHPRVLLPEDLLEAKAPVGLQIGHRMAIPIPDLALTETELSGTLSFRRTPFACRVPWPAIVQISLGEDHILWVETIREGARAGGPTGAEDADGAGDGGPNEAEQEASDPAKPSRRLRLV
jgi:hypothetical protein